MVVDCVYVTHIPREARRQRGAFSAGTVVGRVASTDPAWRRVELVTDRPARVTLRYTAFRDQQVIRCDVGRGGKWDIYASEVSVELESLAGGEGQAIWEVHDIAAPVRRQHHLAEVFAAGSYDSASLARLVPPIHATHITISAASLTATWTLTAYQGADVVGIWDQTTTPASGIPLAGFTRITLTCDARTRVTYTLDL